MSVYSNDTDLAALLQSIEDGKIQLPDFQRDWVWDDDKICKLIESIASGFPMGAAMFLETGNPAVRFTYRKFTGAEQSTIDNPDKLVLDGQQRLTTLFQVFKSNGATIVNGSKNREKRYYYLDIREALNPNKSMLEAVVSIPENKILTENIGRSVKLDLSTREAEYQNMMFPLNIVFSPNDVMDWIFGVMPYGDDNVALAKDFHGKILKGITTYKIPVITLSKDTSKEAVCQIFENVNTGGVKLTVFELITASFAADEYDIRKDWEAISAKFAERSDILRAVSSTNFLTAMTLLASYKRFAQTPDNAVVSCKKRDVLKLTLADYKTGHDALVSGFLKAADFLVHQGVYTWVDLPYSSQLIPLAAIFAYADMAGVNLSIQTNRDILSRWYWCGVFGEQYGAANETRYVLDMVGVFNQIKDGTIPDTVARANLQPGRLLTMQTRNSAAYKGVMALILQDSPLDFMSGNKMDVATYLDECTDIHHIFPQNYCAARYDSLKWNSVVNKTPIYASTNRSIGGRAPSEYIRTMANKGLSEAQIREAITSHKISYDLLAADDFENFIIDRATKLLDRIELAMGKSISGRDSEETIKFFGKSLISK
ncbi:DUF262 domain-containing protein [uncultured Duncaniella sp.]|uniref:GmrSD restriction endonuclease domain-containing protein n=1 Tax=uncultured Duncaniella sp. TaxID=2768039 RepID=UPI00265AF097|nr:DUF262 domain-containing protein [uncultured Duncaniella sp.]